MTEQKTTPKTAKDEKAELVKKTQSEALSPEQKHQNYLDDIERLHNEP